MIFPSVYFDFIPNSWNLQTRGHRGNGCGNSFSAVNARGAVGICHGDGGYTGGGYSFLRSKKRAEEENAGKDCKPADTLYLEDGRKFSISGLKEEVLLNLVDHLKNGTSSEVDSSLF